MSVSTNGPVPAGISGPLHGVADLERRPRRRKPRRSGGPAGRGWLAGLTPYLFIAVAVGLLVLLTYVPAINMIWYSLNDWTGFGPVDEFVGIDNYAAGRTAAYYMAKMLKPRTGSLVALCHSTAYEVHRERVRGFSNYLLEHPNAEHVFARVMFGFDDRLRSAEVFDETLRDHPDIIGIYNAGGANSGIASVLERRGRGMSIMWIGHELTDNSRHWLKSGLMDIVLDQAPEIQARRAVDTILRKVGFIDVEIGTEPVPFLTINAENL